VASPRLLCLIDNTYWITNDDRWEVNNGDFLNYFRVFLQPQRFANGQTVFCPVEQLVAAA
jgi:hypothetical protein